MPTEDLFILESDNHLDKSLSDLDIFIWTVEKLRKVKFASNRNDKPTYRLDLCGIHYFNSQFIANVQSVVNCKDRIIIDALVVIPNYVMTHIWNGKTLGIYHTKLGYFKSLQEWLEFVNSVTFLTYM